MAPEAPTLPIKEAFHADMHTVLPNTAHVLDGAREDLAKHPALGRGAVALGAIATGVYSASAAVEAALVGTGAYFGHKYGWEAGGTAQATLSAAIETSMGALMYLGVKLMPKTIANYADVKYREDEHVKNSARTAGRFATVGFFLGTPGIMTDSVIRKPEHSAERHAAKGAAAVVALAGVNFAIGSGVTKGIEGATSGWGKRAWNSAADWLRERGAGGVNTAVSKVYEVGSDVAHFVGDHTALVGGTAIAAAAGYAGYRAWQVGSRFTQTKQAIKARFSRATA
ncbi:MAG TPA: hypothetical protein VLI54_07155 [Bacillota bacterium]|nr:hypothetical protein [Bacillota bacterium]